jgi:hypothetical protein
MLQAGRWLALSALLSGALGLSEIPGDEHFSSQIYESGLMHEQIMGAKMVRRPGALLRETQGKYADV